MFENMTYTFILQRMLGNVPAGIDKREGSVIYDALAPAALELACFYSKLDMLIDETFADTASREMLIRRAAERGLSPYKATCAIVRGEMTFRENMTAPAVAVNTRFALGELRFKISERISGNAYRLVCEEAGLNGNRTSGELIPLDYIEGLTHASITSLLIPGDDDEDTEHFRRRYFDGLETQSFGGNVADYREKTRAVQGVGAVKVYPAWNGGGTVKLVVSDNGFNVPGVALLNEIRNVMTQTAPIGHSVTVEAVRGTTMNVTARFTLASGWSFADSQPHLLKIADDYFRELSRNWEQLDRVIVRASQLEARLLEAPGIADIANLRMNNSTGNTTLNVDTIPLRGTISHVN